jgi:exonuclease III
METLNQYKEKMKTLPQTYLDQLKKAIPELFQECTKTSELFNSYFSIEFKKICCTETTHYPSRMMQCNGLEDDLLAVVLPQSNRDGIFIATKQGNPVKYISERPQVHRDIDVFAHYPLSYHFNQCKIISWNVEGRCDTPYSRSFRTQRKNSMIQFLESQNPDVVCIQNFFVRKTMSNYTSNSYKIQEELKDFLRKKNKILYRHFNEGSDVILVKNQFLEKPEQTRRDEIEVKATIVPRFNDTSKRTTILYIKNNPSEHSLVRGDQYSTLEGQTPFYVVNMHLKTPKTSTSTHEFEVAEILAQLNRLEHFDKVPAVLIGTFNRDNAEEVLTKARMRSYMRGGNISAYTMRSKSVKVSRASGRLRVPSSRSPGPRNPKTRKLYKRRLV